MTMIDSRAIRTLAAMDIQVWLNRAPKHADAGDARPAAATSADALTGEDPPAETHLGANRTRPVRIRLEAGSGRWLLVVDDADRARHSRLIEDIRAALGNDDCRFGTWSDSAEAGVSTEDWEAHGIRHALVFGGNAGSGFIQGGELAKLALSAEARRALWHKLKPLRAI